MWLITKIYTFNLALFSYISNIRISAISKLIYKDVIFLEFYKNLPYIYFITCYINNSGKFFQIDLEMHLIIVFHLNGKKLII